MKKYINLSLCLLILIACITGCGSSGYTPPDEKVSINPVLYYSFDGDASGTTVTDDSGNKNAGTLSGAAALSAGQARSGKALYLDGNQSYLALPTNLTLPDEVTISMWVYPTAWSSWSRVLDFSSSTTNSNLFLTLRDGANNIVLSTNSSDNKTNNYIWYDNANTKNAPLNTWTQFVITISSTGAKLYKNGISVGDLGKKDVSWVAPSALGTLDHSYLGKSKSPDPYFQGYIDNFRIYNKALTAAQVKYLNYYNQ